MIRNVRHTEQMENFQNVAAHQWRTQHRTHIAHNERKTIIKSKCVIENIWFRCFYRISHSPEFASDEFSSKIRSTIVLFSRLLFHTETKIVLFDWNLSLLRNNFFTSSSVVERILPNCSLSNEKWTKITKRRE